MLELFFSLRQSLPKNPPWKKTHKNAFLVLNIIKIQLWGGSKNLETFKLRSKLKWTMKFELTNQSSNVTCSLQLHWLAVLYKKNIRFQKYPDSRILIN